MDNNQVIREWIQSTEYAAAALREWWEFLRDAAQDPGTTSPSDFNTALRSLTIELGDEWTDRNLACASLDALFEAVTGQEA